MSAAAGYERILVRMVADCDDARGVFVANPEDKRAARSLEKKGAVIVERSTESCAGLAVWYVKATAPHGGT